MATDLGRVKSSASKYDAIVASQLKQAERRIRVLDLMAGLLGFAALSMIYVVGMVLCDSKLLLSQHTRQLSLYFFLAGAAAYLFFAVLRPLRLRVNPYYAARQVEQQLPHAKNSIVNWVDLQEEPLPPAIRGALSKRAAKDLSRVDLDQAINGRRASWMGWIAGVLAVVFIVTFFLIGPGPYVSLLKRTFNPFEEVGVSTRTRLALLKPEGGNASVTVGHSVNFAVDVSGKVPDPRAADALKLLFRYDEGDPWLERRLIQEPSGVWTASLSAIDVKNGFWYKITGGDAATEEYQVVVRAAPAITDFLATYHFRAYAALPDEIRSERELKALRGTEVLVRIRTNRTLHEGRLEFEANEREGRVGSPVATVLGEVNTNEPNTLLVRFVLEEDGKYRLRFSSTDGEPYQDPVAYSVTAIPDQPPTVELTKPGTDIRLPVDALLNLEGKAGDDIGVKSLILRMRVIGGDKLRGQPYRSEEELRLADGGYPRELEYKDFVELSRVRSEEGRDVQLRAGMEIEYWLEASDACDYPQANVAESKRHRVLLTEPQKNDAKNKQERNQAEKDKKQHEQQQDQKLQKENQERQQQRQDQQARNKEQQNKGNGAEKNGAGEKSQSKEGGQGDSSQDKQNDGKENNGQQGTSKDGQGEQNHGESKGELSKEDQNTEDKIKKALDKKQSGENSKGGGASEKNNQGDAKGEQPNKSETGDGSDTKSKSENQGAGQQGAKQTGQDKEKGQQQSGANPSGKGDKGEKNESNGGDPKSQPGQSGEKKEKTESASKSGEKKPRGDAQSSKNSGQGKEGSTGPKEDSTKNDQPRGDGKGEKSKGTGGGKDDKQSEKQQGRAGSKNERSGQGETKSSDGQAESEKSSKGENKQDAKASPRNATAKQVEDLARALDSQDAQKREKAKQQLERIANEAADPEAREKAGEVLEKKGRPDGSSGSKPPKNGRQSSDKPGGQNKEGAKKASSKGTDSSNDQSGETNSKTGQKNQQSGKNRQGASSGQQPEGTSNSEDGTPAAGGDRRSGKGEPGTDSEPKQPEKPRDHRAAQMQLEDFARRVDKNILKEAGVSEEEWQKYLAAKRKQLTTPEKPRPETPNAPQQANQLPSMGGRTIQSAASGQGDEQNTDHGQPLPGYRDSVREFRRQMSKNK
ncbi:MAG TPA: DUF4175 family protein [Gemmataceae bacterium]|jgi:hypothetical protein